MNEPYDLSDPAGIAEGLAQEAVSDAEDVASNVADTVSDTIGEAAEAIRTTINPARLQRLGRDA